MNPAARIGKRSKRRDEASFVPVLTMGRRSYRVLAGGESAYGVVDEGGEGGLHPRPLKGAPQQGTDVLSHHTLGREALGPGDEAAGINAATRKTKQRAGELMGVRRVIRRAL